MQANFVSIMSIMSRTAPNNALPQPPQQYLQRCGTMPLVAATSRCTLLWKKQML